MPASRSQWRGFWLVAMALVLVLAGHAQAQAKTLRFGVYDNAPKVFVNDKGEADGIFPDLLGLIADKQGWTLVPVRCEWSQCLRMLESGDLDFMPDVAATPQRQALFDFHAEPMLHSWSQVYAQAGQKMDSLLDLKDKRLAVLRDSVQASYLLELKTGLGVSFELVEVDSLEQGFRRVADHQADAVESNHHYGDAQATKYQLIPSSIIMQPAALFMAASKRQNLRAELDLIDQQLRSWKADVNSDYHRVLYKWSGGSNASFRMFAVMKWVLGATLGALLLALAFGGMLKREVRRVTAELKASRDELNTILDGVGAHVYIKDTELRYQYATQDVDTAPWTVAVNVSAKQFQQENFVEDIQDILRQTQANPHRLELELTESVLVSDVEVVETKMRQLAGLGIQLALDDFGTGYSSLNYIKRLPLHKLKIDKSFIDDLNSDPHSEAIVRTVASMAKHLGLAVIAEGVETESQVATLRAIGEIEFQGYFFGKPMTPGDFQRWHERYRAGA